MFISLRDDVMTLIANRGSSVTRIVQDQPEMLGLFRALDETGGLADRDVFRLGQLLRLDLVETGLLMVKKYYAEFRAQRRGENIDDERLRAEFHIDPDPIYAACPQEWLEAEQFSKDAFSVLIRELALLRLYLQPVACDALKRFRQRFSGEMAIDNRELKAEFMLAKLLYVQVSAQIPEFLCLVAERELANSQVERRFAVTFPESVGLAEAEARCRRAMARLRLLAQQPSLNEEDLAELTSGELAQELAKVDAIRLDLALGVADDIPEEGAKLSDAEFRAFRRKYSLLWRKIAFITHSDKTGGNPELGKIFQTLLRVRPEEAGVARNSLGYHFRSLHVLESIYLEARAIAANAGLEIDNRMAIVIEGATLKERIEFLRRASVTRENQLAILRTRLLALLHDEVVQRHAQLLGDVDRHAEIRAEIVQVTDRLNGEAAELEQEVADRLAR